MMTTYRGVAFPWLCDQQGHLNTAQYMAMFDVAAHHLLDELQRDTVPDPVAGWADVRHEVDYKAEVAVGTLTLVQSGILRIGRSSITHRHVMMGSDRSKTYAELLATTVRFDTRARAATPLSQAMRSRAEALLVAP